MACSGRHRHLTLLDVLMLNKLTETAVISEFIYKNVLALHACLIYFHVYIHVYIPTMRLCVRFKLLDFNIYRLYGLDLFFTLKKTVLLSCKRVNTTLINK